jgi:thioredoxin 1
LSPIVQSRCGARSEPNRWSGSLSGRLAFVALLLAGLAFALASSALARQAAPTAASASAPAALPRMMDLGANKCIPCKRMAPILEALKVDYAGAVDVQFIDVWQNPTAGQPYKIRLIPTQIFFDRKGQERFRHEGFFAREEIERILKDSLGVTLRPATAK